MNRYLGDRLIPSGNDRQWGTWYHDLVDAPEAFFRMVHESAVQEMLLTHDMFNFKYAQRPQEDPNDPLANRPFTAVKAWFREKPRGEEQQRVQQTEDVSQPQEGSEEGGQLSRTPEAYALQALSFEPT